MSWKMLVMASGSQRPKRREEVRRVVRTRRDSPRTENTHWYSTRYFIRCHGMRHLFTMVENEVREFLT